MTEILMITLKVYKTGDNQQTDYFECRRECEILSNRKVIGGSFKAARHRNEMKVIEAVAYIMTEKQRCTSLYQQG